MRLRDIAARTSITGRTAYGIVTDLTEAGYVVKQPLPDPGPAAAPRDRQPGTRHRRDPGAPGRRRRRSDRIIPVTLTGERHRRHLVTPGTVITPAVRQG
jgi:hypothetical protein